MVITGTTGNRVYPKRVPRVQIPPAPPNKGNRYSFENAGFFCISGDLYSEMLCFLIVEISENSVFPLVFPLVVHGLNELFHSCGAITFHLICDVAINIKRKRCSGMA